MVCGENENHAAEEKKHDTDPSAVPAESSADRCSNKTMFDIQLTGRSFRFMLWQSSVVLTGTGVNAITAESAQALALAFVTRVVDTACIWMALPTLLLCVLARCRRCCRFRTRFHCCSQGERGGKNRVTHYYLMSVVREQVTSRQDDAVCTHSPLHE